MRVVATTVVRESIRGKQRTGNIYDVDWETGVATAAFAVPEPVKPESDLNPRGGSRGGRGAAAIGDTFVVANYDTLLVYDRDVEAGGLVYASAVPRPSRAIGMAIACMSPQPRSTPCWRSTSPRGR